MPLSELIAEHIAQLPILLAVVVWGIEWYGHRTHQPWSFEIGIPLGKVDELLDAPIPTPVPEDWVSDFRVETIVGPRLTFTTENDSEHVALCFGVLTFYREGKRTHVRYSRRASFGPLAFAAAAIASVRLNGASLELMLIGGAIVVGGWLLYVWRHRKQLDETYHVLTAALLRAAVKRQSA